MSPCTYVYGKIDLETYFNIETLKIAGTLKYVTTASNYALLCESYLWAFLPHHPLCHESRAGVAVPDFDQDRVLDERGEHEHEAAE